MRVLHLLEASGGGTRRHVLDLLPALRARGIESELLFSPLRHPAFFADAARLREQGIKAGPLAMERGLSPRTDARALRWLVAHLRHHPPDVLHLHSFKAGFVGRLAAAFVPRVPVVYTPHCIAFDTGLPPAQRRTAFLVEKLLAARTTCYIAVSRREEAVIARHLVPLQRVAYVPNGVEASGFTVSPRRHDRSFTVGCFGRLTAQKHQALLIRALPRLRREVAEARLLLCGGGEDEAGLRALADRLGVEECVTWTGEVADVRPLYACCDVVAVPSRWEGCPYAALEAMACGLPVVGAAVGGVPELLGAGAGVLLDTYRVETWAGALAELWRDEAKRHRLGEAARERVAAYTIERMARATANIYERVAR